MTKWWDFFEEISYATIYTRLKIPLIKGDFFENSLKFKFFLKIPLIKGDFFEEISYATIYTRLKIPLKVIKETQ